MLRFLFILFALLSSCSYQIMHTSRKLPSGVKSVHLPMTENHTLHPRAEVFATNALSDAITLDGTLRIVSADHADAILYTEITRIKYDQIRSNRYDVLRPEALQNTVFIHWKLVSNKTNKTILEETTTGFSRFFVDSNLQTARQNALPDAMQRTATNIISRITNSF